jgi:hypothetical protein
MGFEATPLVKLLFQTGVVDKERLAKRRRAAPVAVVRRLIVGQIRRSTETYAEDKLW